MLHVVEDAPGHHLLGEADNVCLNPKVLVAPHLPSGSTPCLHLSDQEDEDDDDDEEEDVMMKNLVHHERDVVVLADLCQASEERWRPVVVASLGLWRLPGQPMCLQALSSPAVDSDLWPSNIERATTVASVHS